MNGCHLTRWFHLEPNKYEVILIIASLASYTRFGFAIKPTAWRKFFGCHQFAIDNCASEFDQKKIDFEAYKNGTLPSQL
jgi:hypothetical protein